MPEAIKCPECGNDGRDDGIFYAVDFRLNADTGKFEESGPHDEGELDCLACDHRWFPSEEIELA